MLKWLLLTFPATMMAGIILNDAELVISAFVMYPFAIYAFKLVESTKI